MKAITIFALSVILLKGCSENRPVEKEPSQRKYNFIPVESDEGLLNALPSGNNKLTFQKGHFEKQQSDFRTKMSQVDIITTPQELNTDIKRKAEERYMYFLNKFKNDAVLPAYKAKFASIILKDYDIINSTDYQKIGFYSKEILNSISVNKLLLIESLKKLKGNSNNFEVIKELSLTKINSEITTNTEILLKLKENFANNKTLQGNLKPEFIKAVHERVISDLEKKIQEARNALNEISGL